jgi:hypothetical protein
VRAAGRAVAAFDAQHGRGRMRAARRVVAPFDAQHG